MIQTQDGGKRHIPVALAVAERVDTHRARTLQGASGSRSRTTRSTMPATARQLTPIARVRYATSSASLSAKRLA